jgi:ABC-type multidrug transport system fused ATPase/permease subunit
MLQGAVAWISFAVTTIGIGLALWQIFKTKKAAQAAASAASSLTKAVRHREHLLQLQSCIAALDNARNHIGRDSKEAAIIFIDLSLTALAATLELSTEPDRNLLKKHQLRLRNASNTLEEMAGYISEDTAYFATVKSLKLTSETLKSLAARSRYSYQLDEDQQ